MRYVCGNFNPLRPRGRRLTSCRSLLMKCLFQPTPPARTETPIWTPTVINYLYFNPLRPRGRRRLCTINQSINLKFQPTPPARTETHPLVDLLWMVYDFNPLRPRGRRLSSAVGRHEYEDFNPLRPRGRRQQYYTKKPTILHHISTIKSHHTPSNHRQPTLHTSKAVFTVQFFRCESPRKFMFASGSHQTI